MSASVPTSSTRAVASRITPAGCIWSPRCCAAVSPPRRRARSPAATICASSAPRLADRLARAIGSQQGTSRMKDISGKTAIVTGAASGIGLGIAEALAEAGANVVMADIQKDAVEQAAHALSGTNKRVMPVRIDVTQEQSVLDALAEAERNFGKLHIACNNAGVPMHGTKLIDVPVEDWEFVIGVNIWGVIHGIRHFVPTILRHGEEGHIVNTASVAGFQNR